MAEQKYRASTGVDEFYFAPLLEVPALSVYTAAIERIKFLQSMEIEMSQEIVRAYGDNKTAELAVSNGNTTVSSAFHTLPEEIKAKLFGLEVTTGLNAYGGDDTPPYVACVFAKTYEDGSKQWVGLVKGMFMKNNIAGETKEDSTTFSNEEISAEFMERKVEGFTGVKTVITAVDEKGSTVNRDALFMAVFGLEYPAVV